MESSNSVLHTRKIYGPFSDASSNHTFLKHHYNYSYEILHHAWLMQVLIQQEKLHRATSQRQEHLLEVKMPSVQSLEKKLFL